MSNVLHQIRDNLIALVSLAIAIIALYHNERLYQKSEYNRNVRTAAFEVLIHLGELQQVVNAIHYNHSANQQLLMQGWGHIALISDLAQLISNPVPTASSGLLMAWKENVESLKETSSADSVSQQIDATRQSILTVIKELR